MFLPPSGQRLNADIINHLTTVITAKCILFILVYTREKHRVLDMGSSIHAFDKFNHSNQFFTSSPPPIHQSNIISSTLHCTFTSNTRTNPCPTTASPAGHLQPSVPSSALQTKIPALMEANSSAILEHQHISL